MVQVFWFCTVRVFLVGEDALDGGTFHFSLRDVKMCRAVSFLAILQAVRPSRKRAFVETHILWLHR